MFHRFGLRKIRRFTRDSQFQGDDVFVKVLDLTVLPVLYFGIIYASFQSLKLNPTLATALDASGAIVVAICCILGVQQLIEYSLGFYYAPNRYAPEKRERNKAKVNLISPAIRVVLWAVGIVFLLQNLGYDLSAVVASLGIGGIAIALASQGLLQDLFSYFAIVLDVPFSIGDFIVVDDYAGTVKHIGIKTTRLESISGEQLVFPNQYLTSAKFQNFQEMKRRQVVFSLGVIYDTTREKLIEIPRVIQEIIEAIENTEFVRSHFASYGASSLDIETVYYVLDSDYLIYMNIQQQITFAIWDAFKSRNIEFAYPSQTIYLDPPVNGNRQGPSPQQLSPNAHDPRKPKPHLTESN
ncbi:MAG: mechanosensitive ion channel family protein [Cyanophyceae cyanobacterium]